MPEHDSDVHRIIGDHGGRIEQIERRLDKIDTKLDEILATVNKAKGGWGVVLALGGLGGAIGAGVTKWLSLVMAAPK